MGEAALREAHKGQYQNWADDEPFRPTSGELLGLARTGGARSRAGRQRSGLLAGISHVPSYVPPAFIYSQCAHSHRTFTPHIHTAHSHTLTHARHTHTAQRASAVQRSGVSSVCRVVVRLVTLIPDRRARCGVSCVRVREVGP